MVVSAADALGLSINQFHNAQGIIRAVKKRGWGVRAAVIAIEVALTESGMRILASANVPASVNHPHDLLSWTFDGLGHDHASCGMYQQQTGWRWAVPGTTTMSSPDGWGTPAQLMDPEASTSKFLNALAHVDWQYLPRWVAAQAVQHSAFADGSNYRQQDAQAQHIGHSIWTGVVIDPPVVTPAPSGSSWVSLTKHAHYTVRRGDTLASIAQRFHTNWRRLQHLNNLRNPNVLYVGQVLRVPMVGAVAKSKPKPTQASAVRIVGGYEVKRGDTLAVICQRYPQEWITPASVAHINGLSNPNHLVIGQRLRIGG